MHRSVPLDRHTLIRRSRLLERLAEWPALRLIAVTAPTGFGKSTLIADWIRSLPDDSAVTWLALGPEHASAHSLVLAIGEALLPHLPSLAEPLTEFRAGHLSPDQLAPIIASQIDQSASPILCILDDLHLVSDPRAHQFLQNLLDHAPPHFHLILISRTAIPLRFTRLLLHGEALTLDDRHLRFDHDEFLAFVRLSRLAALSESQHAEIERRADGWAAALRLFDLSLTDSPTTDVAEILGPHSDRLLIEHLKAEVLDHLPPDLLSFLLDAAPLPFLTAEFIAAAAERDVHACHAFLQQILQANLFISAFESASGRRYHIHPLLRESLMQIAAGDAARVATIRRRAADWLAAHHHIDLALALLVPDFPDAAADMLVAGPLRTALLDFDLAAARRWLAMLPSTAIDARPQLTVDAAWLAFFSGDGDMNRAADRAQAVLAAYTDQPAHAELRAEAALLDAYGQILLGNLGAAQTAAETALRLPCTEFGLAAGYRCMLQVMLPGPSKSPDSDRRALRDAEAVFRRIHFAHGALEMAGSLAVYAQRVGDAEGACAAFENALAIVQIFGRENSYVAIDLHLFYGDHLYHLDRIAEARAHLQFAIDICTRHHIGAASAYQASICLQLCELAENHTISGFDPQNDARTWNEIVRAHTILECMRAAWLRLIRDTRMNAPERCRQTFDSLGVVPADLTAAMHDLVWLTSLGGAVLGRAPIDAALISSRLRDLCRRMEETENLWIANRARAALATHLVQQGDIAGAHDALQPLAARDDCRRLILNFPALTTLNADAAAQPHREALSERERQIVSWFATDRTNKEIAHTLSISLHTLYTHTQNIYRKLGVHSRKEAVRAVAEK